MITSTLARAEEQLAQIAAADDVLLALAAGKSAVIRRADAPSVWCAVAQRLRGFEGGRHAKHANVGLADLNVRLTALLDEVRSGALSAADAVEPYRLIRQAQEALSATAAGGNGNEVEVPQVHLRMPLPRLLQIAGTIDNIDEAWPDWRNAMRGGYADSPPWEHEAHRPLQVLPNSTNLRWLASGEARPWVPTLAEAMQAAATQMQAEEARYINAGRPIAG